MTRCMWLLIALALIAASGCAEVQATRANSAALAAEDSLQSVVKRTFTAYGFRLESGVVLPEMTLAYETYGRLAGDGRNAILITHGFTSSQRAAGRYTSADRAPGWWDNLIGPGKAIDTERYFVVSSNILGSSYGSTAPRSINPATGKPYGPDFPDITLGDIVAAQKLLLDGLGVKRLVAVVGPSYGGFQAFQWAISYPRFMLGVVPVVSGPRSAAPPDAVATRINRFAKDLNWNGGWHYDRGGIPATMTALRIETLKRYGIDAVLARTIPEPAQREARIRQMSVAWARDFDPNSMTALGKAASKFSAEPEFRRIRAKVLYVLSRTDRLFPPSIAPDVMDKLAKAGVDAKYFELDSDLGHLASGPDWAKWAPALKEFLGKLER